MRQRTICGVSPRMPTILAAIVFAVPTAALAELPKYQMLDLGTLGGSISAATAINNKGQVTGHAATETAISEVPHAFLYSDGTMVDIGTLGLGFASYGRDINDAGQVAGDSAELISDGVRHAFLFSDGNLIDLGTLIERSYGIAINSSGQVAGMSVTSEGDGCGFLASGGQLMSECIGGGENFVVTDVNDDGEITGYFDVPDDVVCDEFGCTYGSHAFVYEDGSIIDLGTLGGIGSEARAINAAGQVTGFARAGNGSEFGFSHAFLYSNGTMIDLGTLGGLTSHGRDINDTGQVTGKAATETGNEDLGLDFPHAFLYSEDTMIDLGTLGGPSSEGRAINNAGQVTGYATTPEGYRHAFVFSDGTMIDLGTLGGQSSDGIAINEVGQVAGYSDTGEGDQHAFLATPISLLLSRLLDDVTGVGPGRSLADSLSAASAYYVAADLQATCAALDSFSEKVRRFATQRKPKIPSGDAAEFLEDAQAIQNALSCA